MIIMENQFAIQYALQADESIGICTYIPDPVLVQDIYDRFSLRFSTQNPILASAKVLGIDYPDLCEELIRISLKKYSK